MSSRMQLRHCVPILLSCVVFVLVPLNGLDYLRLMPGDLGDARLNNYFLENVYQYFFGRSQSLWEPGFFYPLPYVLGFSDNLFGSAPIYILIRLLRAQTDTAFQLWFLFGYAVNFTAAYYALRKLGTSTIAASIGALIFTFALPTTAHTGHAQLHYRFGLPLALAFFSNFLDQKKWHSLLVAGIWTVWQFYCGIYIGFFTLFFLAAMSVARLFQGLVEDKQSPKAVVVDLWQHWKLQPKKSSIKIIASFGILVLLLALLFYPYLQVTKIYEAKRQWSEIESMLPRPQSYVYTMVSTLWPITKSAIFSGIPMRHEHQMFAGAIPLVLALMGVVVGSKVKNGRVFLLILGVLVIAVVSTIDIDGLSIWYLFHKLPLASAIRAMSRIDVAILFPIAYFAAIAIDWMRPSNIGTSLVSIVILPLMILEFSAVTTLSSAKETWRLRSSNVEHRLDRKLDDRSIIFLSQGIGDSMGSELDAMILAQSTGVKTLNGYSGLAPRGYPLSYKNDCSELPRRIISYLNLTDQSKNVDLYRELIGRTVTIGFDGCQKSWLTSAPEITVSASAYTPEEIKNLVLVSAVERLVGDDKIVDLRIRNSGKTRISAISGVEKPMRISWRFLTPEGVPATGFDTRKDFPFDVPAGGDLVVSIQIDEKMAQPGSALEFSFVQEGLFWAHDVGVRPIMIAWK